jgi:hypothetical protein
MRKKICAPRASDAGFSGFNVDFGRISLCGVASFTVISGM